MTDNKKYYWFKLRDDFFSSLSMKKLRRLEGGETCILIYLKMLLYSMNTDGNIHFEGLENNLCEELAILLDERTEDVTATVQFLLKCGLAEESDNDLLLTELTENIGTESASAKRMRRLREKQSVDTSCDANVTLCDADVTTCDADVTQRRDREEIEKEKEKEKRESDGADRSAKRVRFAAPSLDEIRQYVRERNLSVDPVSFYTYFDAGGWTDSRGQKVRSWKQKLLTWENHNDNRGGKIHDSEPDYSNNLSKWDNAYSFDGRKM